MPFSVGAGIPCTHSIVYILETDQWIGKGMDGIEEHCNCNHWTGRSSRWNVYQFVGDHCNIYRIVFLL